MDLTLVFIVVAILVGFWLILGGVGKNKNQSTAPSRIMDSEVNIGVVMAYLCKFSPTIRADRKNGFTEKDVHDELEVYLKDIFHSVTREYAIEGKNVKRIDFDLGNGAVGVEVKLAESVLSEGENDRVIGQMRKYIDRKYNNGGLIIALAGLNRHTRDTVIHELRDDVVRNGSNFIFMEGIERKDSGRKR